MRRDKYKLTLELELTPGEAEILAGAVGDGIVEIPIENGSVMMLFNGKIQALVVAPRKEHT